MSKFIIYESFSWLYNLFHHIQTFWRDDFWRKKAAQCLPRDAKIVLDLCTGTGLTIKAIKKSLPNSKLIGIDISSNMIYQAKKKFYKKNRIYFVRGDIRALPFLNNTFDAAISICGLGGVQECSLALQEIKRVLVPGGILFCVEMCEPKNKGIIYFLHKMIIRPWISIVWGFRDIELDKEVQKSFFNIISCNYRLELGLGSLCEIIAIK